MKRREIWIDINTRMPAVAFDRTCAILLDREKAALGDKNPIAP